MQPRDTALGTDRPGNDRPADARTVLSADDVGRALTRIAHEIVERNHGAAQLVLVGLQRGGVWMAEALAALLSAIDPVT